MGNNQDVDCSATVTGFDATSGGLTFGFERVSETGTGRKMLGVSASYGVTDLDSGASSADIDSYALGIYGSVEYRSWQLSGASIGMQDYDTTRNIAVGDLNEFEHVA